MDRRGLGAHLEQGFQYSYPLAATHVKYQGARAEAPDFADRLHYLRDRVVGNRDCNDVTTGDDFGERTDYPGMVGLFDQFATLRERATPYHYWRHGLVDQAKCQRQRDPSGSDNPDLLEMR